MEASDKSQKFIALAGAATAAVGLAYLMSKSEKKSVKAEEPKLTPNTKSRKLLVGGNWKSNPPLAKVKELSETVLNKLKFDSSKVEVVIAPQAHHMTMLKELIDAPVSPRSGSPGPNKERAQVMCQNVSLTSYGAYTGEISAESVKEIGVMHAITGHSERRHIFGETDADVAKKTKNALDQGMTALVCIGEKLEERESGTTNEVNARQLNALLKEDANIKWSKIVIAYEPVWAIGTGKTASAEVAQETHMAIRAWIAKNVNQETADTIQILYGGSVSDKNCEKLISMPDIDGFLVGGASLKPAFSTIVSACNNHAKK